MPIDKGYPRGVRDQSGALLRIGATADGQFLKRSGTSIVTEAAGPAGYTDEQAQDAVGGIVEAASLAYNDTTPSIAVKRQMSITADTAGLLLDGDTAEPGANQVYGTDGAGAKGWKADPAGGTHAGTHVTGGGDTIADAVADGNAGLMSGVDKAKLDAVAAGAEVNVNADWDASTGDAQILNKPALLGAHDLGGASHNADTLAHLNAKVSDAALVALAGQLGGTAASPDVRGVRETGGPTLLTMGAVAEGQYLKRNGSTIDGGSPGGGSSPAWDGTIYGALGNCDPNLVLRTMLHNPIHATPTNITVTPARCAYFRPPANITVNSIRFFGVGATTGVYHVAIYATPAGGARLTADLSPNTVAQAWGTAVTGLGLALTAGTLYLIAVSVDTTGTTAGIACLSGTTGRIGVLPASWPGNLDIDAASPKIDPVAFCQFAVSAGALPATLPTIVAQAAWTGGMPAIFLDNA